VLLKKAVEWDVIERMPRTVRLLPIPKGSAGFYDFEAAEVEPDRTQLGLIRVAQSRQNR
jgi:hypothetical protein